uniref:Dynein light chain n=1 Tax=Apteryx owenii TaxID=8824 RepID=A0A8B9S976_APTOW
MVLTRFEEENSNMTQVEVDEVLTLMSHMAAKVPSHNTMPSGMVFLVKLLCDFMLNAVLLQRLNGALHSVLLHLLRHVRILDHGFLVTRGHLH